MMRSFWSGVANGVAGTLVVWLLVVNLWPARVPVEGADFPFEWVSDDPGELATAHKMDSIRIDMKIDKMKKAFKTWLVANGEHRDDAYINTRIESTTPNIKALLDPY